MREIVFSKGFQKEFRKIRDKSTRLRLIKQIKKISEAPYSGKPLRYSLKNYRSLRISPFRIIYRLEKDKIIVNCFDHRKMIY